MAKNTEKKVEILGSNTDKPDTGVSASTAEKSAAEVNRNGRVRNKPRIVRHSKPRKARNRAKRLAAPVRAESDARTSGRAQRPFPARTLEEALAVPGAIRHKNNGNDWDSEQVAKAAAGVTKANNKFFYLAAAARDYGLTVGS